MHLRTLALALLTGLTAAQISSESQPCYPLEYIYVRGTTEPLPLGFILGPAMKRELDRLLGDQVLLVGLDYPASVATNSPTIGIAETIRRVEDRAVECPESQFALTGYSQGAAVVHYALDALAPLQSRIAAVVNFGDPFARNGFPQVYEGRVLQACAPNDVGCGGVAGGDVGHLSYGSTQLHVRAMEFVAEVFTNPPEIDESKPAQMALPGGWFGQGTNSTAPGYVPPVTWE